MKKLLFSTVIFALAVLNAFLPAAIAGAASPREPEEIWQELLKLPMDERQKRLVAGARAEGKAIVYGNISADHLEKLRVDFDKRYGVKLDGYRASGERVSNRLLTEARSGKLDANDGFQHGDLPKGPDHPVIKDKLIAAWNGGTKDCTGTESPSPTPSASTPASTPSTPAEGSSTPTPSASESTPGDSDTPVESASSSAPAASPNGGGDLAETGGGSDSGIIAGGAAALLAAGAAIVVAAKRRRGSHS